MLKVLHSVVLSSAPRMPDDESKTLISPFYYITSPEQITVTSRSLLFFQVTAFESNITPTITHPFNMETYSDTLFDSFNFQMTLYLSSKMKH